MHSLWAHEPIEDALTVVAGSPMNSDTVPELLKEKKKIWRKYQQSNPHREVYLQILNYIWDICHVSNEQGHLSATLINPVALQMGKLQFTLIPNLENSPLT